MKRAVTLKENHEFRRTYKGASAVSGVMVLYCRKNRLGSNRLGLTASTKLGHAVVRNRCRRRLREVYRLHSGGSPLVQAAELMILFQCHRSFHCSAPCLFGAPSQPVP